MNLNRVALYSSVFMLVSFPALAQAPARALQKDFSQASYNVVGGSQVNSALTNIKVVVIQTNNTTVSWSISFHVHNSSEETGDGNTSLYVDLVDQNGGTLPGGRLSVASWRDHCYYAAAGDKSYSGNIVVPYNDFVGRAVGIRISDSGAGATVGGC